MADGDTRKSEERPFGEMPRVLCSQGADPKVSWHCCQTAGRCLLLAASLFSELSLCDSFSSYHSEMHCLLRDASLITRKINNELFFLLLDGFLLFKAVDTSAQELSVYSCAMQVGPLFAGKRDPRKVGFCQNCRPTST